MKPPIFQVFKAIAREEYSIILILASVVIFVIGGDHVLSDISTPWWIFVTFVWLFAVIMWSSLAVVRHAECLAVKCGEPYGTLILTLSVISIEVMTIGAVMLHGANNPTLATETMFAVIMIILNGMVGVSLLLGGLRYREQQYNLQGANAYLSVIVVLCVLGLVMPGFTAQGAAALPLSNRIFQVCISLGLYVIFLFIQTLRHRSYFMGPELQGEEERHGIAVLHSIPHHTILLLIYLAAVILLAKKFAIPLDYSIETLGAPQALGGVIIAILVCIPELIGAVRAALDNHLQRSVNIALGSVLATICLTIPVILIIGFITHHDVYLGLHGAPLVLLLLTLAISTITFTSSKTNILQGSVHLLLFLAYILFIF